MATSSIFTNVRVKSKTACRRLFAALEHAEGKKAKQVIFSRPVEIVKDEKVKEIFK